MVDQAERRRSQRVTAHLPLQLYLDRDSTAGDQATALETINISASGVYFRSPVFIEPMTKLDLALEVTVPGDAGGPAQPALVRCQGLVVRIQPEAELPRGSEYEVAVFFTWIEPDDQSILQEHIDLRLQGG
ncbi:MAG: PilZ domain-containing protein [Candidatus Krumholzibacteria bacterium]|nr:PilZ domain-containing protein [Candidatus Krumholzibacteria bacterium]